MYREHDPSGKRTVGVVAKPDRADPGIRDRLEATGADHLRLDLGYVAVCSSTVTARALHQPAKLFTLTSLYQRLALLRQLVSAAHVAYLLSFCTGYNK